MVRFRTLAAVLVIAVLAALPVLRSACDLDCAAPTTRVGAAAEISTAASHCPQHPDSSTPATPAPKDDGCGHDHHAQRMTAARMMHFDTGIVFTPVPVLTGPLVNAHTVVLGTFAACPPMIRPPAASAQLRI